MKNSVISGTNNGHNFFNLQLNFDSNLSPLEQKRDRIFANLMELGVNEEWLMEANFTREEMTQLLKGILYLKEMQT